jgi:hypothetical protein
MSIIITSSNKQQQPSVLASDFRSLLAAIVKRFDPLPHSLHLT